MINKIYCFYNGASVVVAIAEDGTCLAEHLYTGVDGGSMLDSMMQYVDAYNEHYDNWEIEWVDNIDKHKGITNALLMHETYMNGVVH